MKRDIKWWQVLAVCILIAGVILTIWSAWQQDESLHNDLLIKTNIAKMGISTEYVEALDGSPADSTRPEYQALKAQLEKIRGADPDIRFAYLVSQRDDGTIIINVDSEQPGSGDYSPPGQVYTEAPTAIRSVFKTGNKANEGPYTDRWGVWLSGFVPVTDPGTGAVTAVFGIDVNAKDWNLAIFRACLPMLITTLLILLLVLLSAFFQRRNDEEKRRLETSEEKFSKAFQANPALMMLSTLDEDKILDVNKNLLASLGYSREEVIGRTTSDLGLFFDPTQRNAILIQVRETGHVSNMEVKLHRKNLDLLYGSLTSITIDLAGTSSLFTFIIDLTERMKAEDALRDREEKYHLLIDNSHDVIYTINLGGIFTFVSPSWTTLLGHPLDQVIGKPFHQFVHPDDIAKCLSFMERTFGTGQRQTGVEYRVQHADGSWRWHTTNALPLRDKTGRIVGGEGSASDITERKRAEAALNDNYLFMQALIQTIPIPVFIKNRDGKYMGCNVSLENFYGRSRDEIIGKTVYEVAPKEIADEYFKTDEELINHPGTQCYESRVISKNGQTRDVIIDKATIMNSDGEVTGIIGVMFDITERKQAEGNLQRVIDCIINSAPDPLENIASLTGLAGDLLHADYAQCIIRTRGTITPVSTWNREGKDIENAYIRAPDESQDLLHSIEGYLHLSTGQTGTASLSEPSDIVFPLHTYLSKAVSVNSEYGSILNIFYRQFYSPTQSETEILSVIAAAIGMEEKRKYALDQLKDFAYIVSHDLRAPLRGISTLITWMRDDYAGILDKEGIERLNLMENRTKRMQNLIEGVLVYSRIGRTAQETISLPIRPLIMDILDSLSPPPTYTFNIPEDMPTILVDKTKITQIFENLLSNAIKYAGREDAVIDLVSERKERYYLFGVRDNGPGIDPKFHERIFLLFQTVHKRNDIESSGVGLTIAKKLVEDLGGSIWVESDGKNGTVFFFTIPYHLSGDMR